MSFTFILHLVAARVVLNPQNGEVIAGRSAVVVCMAHGVPVPTITWVKSSTILTNDSRVIIQETELIENGMTFVRSILKICSASESDGGQYSCIANNVIGNDSFSFEVTITVEGMKPQNFYYNYMACRMLRWCMVIYNLSAI